MVANAYVRILKSLSCAVRILREGSSSLLDGASLAASILGAEWEKSGGFNIQDVNIHILLFSIWISLSSAVPDFPSAETLRFYFSREHSSSLSEERPLFSHHSVGVR